MNKLSAAELKRRSNARMMLYAAAEVIRQWGYDDDRNLPHQIELMAEDIYENGRKGLSS